MVLNKASRKTKNARARILIEDIIHRLELNLSGIFVITEIGSENYTYTPLIAALAGAENIVAVSRDSRYGKAQEIKTLGLELAKSWDIHDRLNFVSTLTPEVISEADIVTNLGFVRPIDAEFISHLHPGAVIPYMREAWEYRPEDVDLVACREKDIPVMGTNENYPGLGVFDYSGPLAAKMLFEAGLEVKGNNILVASKDDFGDVICNYLRNCGAKVWRVERPSQSVIEEEQRIDALLVACLSTDEKIVAEGGWIKPSDLAAHPECMVIQFAGDVDTDALRRNQVLCMPEERVGPRRMAKTLAALGPKPVIELHAAGLKVGELMWREKRSGQNAANVICNLSFPGSLCQAMQGEKTSSETFCN